METDHSVYCQLIGHGMPEGLCGEEQGKWLYQKFQRMRNELDAATAEVSRLTEMCCDYEADWMPPSQIEWAIGEATAEKDAEIQRLQRELAAATAESSANEAGEES